MIPIKSTNHKIPNYILSFSSILQTHNFETVYKWQKSIEEHKKYRNDKSDQLIWILPNHSNKFQSRFE